MIDSDRSDTPDGLIAGRLEGLSLPDLLWALCRRGRTGTLTVSHEGISKTIHIEGGRIIFASSSDPDDRIGELLLRRGAVGLDELEQAIRRLHTGKRLGTLLVEAGSLSAGELVETVLAQVHGIVLDLFQWEEGEYRFTEGSLPSEEVITLGVKTSELLFQGIRSIRSFARIRRSVGPLGTVYGLTDEWRQALTGVTLSEGERQITVRLQESDSDVETVCGEVFLSNFETYQALWALKVVGAVQERELAVDEQRGDALHEGSLAGKDFAEVLVELCRQHGTGVLRVAHGQRERTFHLVGGRCVFATSNDIDDGLMAYLLRRGVISLRDREEVARRLLSNRRAGAILLELGVIDEQELADLVRQQLTEIVHDTFRWDDGEWVFCPGELPSNEEITLDVPVASLVSSGLRRVVSWSRVHRGCGGVDRPLELAPSYLEVLDSIGAGPDEWQVVTALKSPKTPRGIGALVELSDYRTCQTVWILRTLGAVRRAVAVEQPVAEAPAAESEPQPVSPAEPARHVDVVPLDEDGDVEPEIPVAASHVVADSEPSVAMAETPSYDEVELPGEDDEPSLEIAGDVATIDDAASAYEADAGLVDLAAIDRPVDVEPRQEPEATQALDREEVERALQAEPVGAEPADDEPELHVEPEPEATQALDREEIERAIRAEPATAGFEAAGSADDEPEPREEPEPESEATQALDRATIDSALRDEDDGEQTLRIPREPEPTWDPPADLDEIIARFNAAQKLLYRAIRAEVGAGAANVVRACCGQLAAGGDVFSDAEMHADGSWDSESLRRAVRENRVNDPWSNYRKLMEREIDVLRMHIGEARAHELQRQVEQLDAGAPEGQTARPPE